MTTATNIVLSDIQLSGLEAISRVEGGASGAILALHGGGYSAGYWNYAENGASFLDLAASMGFHALALDRPGYGQSFGVKASCLTLVAQVDILYRAIEQWVDRLDFRGPVFVIGHSLGGIITLLMAADARAAGLTAVATCGVPVRFADNDSGRTVSSWDIPPEYFPILTPEQHRNMMFGPDGTYSAAAYAYDLTTLRPMPSPEYEEAIDQPRRWPLLLPSITLPVQFTLAEFEAMTETGAEVLAEVAAMLRGSDASETLLQPQSGHNISLHHVARDYHLTVLAFFTSCLARCR